MRVCHAGAMSDETETPAAEPDAEFDDVLADETDLPVDEYRLSTR